MSNRQVDDSLTVFNRYVETLRKTMTRQYDRSVNRDLAQQQPQELLLRNVRAVLNQLYQQSLEYFPEGQGSAALEVFNGIQNELIGYAVKKHRTSCAISHFPDEHSPSNTYIAKIFSAVEQDWQCFVKTLKLTQ